jgi:hypothetical protein
MTYLKKCTAIKPWLLLALMWPATLVYAAQGIGSVTHLSGPLLAKKADGTIRVLALKSILEPGDTLVTQEKTYAQIRFDDDSQLTLQPATTLSIDKFSYDAAKSDADNIAFTLIRGGVRSIAGLLGKRSKDRVILATPVAQIALQDGSAIVQYREPNVEDVALQRDYLRASTAMLDAPLLAIRSDSPAAAIIQPLMLAQIAPRPIAPPGSPSLPPGLYVQVNDGAIIVSNRGGVQNFAAGQFGFTPSPMQPPVMVPQNPALKFTPPPAFSAPAPPPGTASPGKSNEVNCIVR